MAWKCEHLRARNSFELWTKIKVDRKRKKIKRQMRIVINCSSFIYRHHFRCTGAHIARIVWRNNMNAALESRLRCWEILFNLFGRLHFSAKCATWYASALHTTRMLGARMEMWRISWALYFKLGKSIWLRSNAPIRVVASACNSWIIQKAKTFSSSALPRLFMCSPPKHLNKQWRQRQQWEHGYLIVPCNIVRLLYPVYIFIS